MSVQFLNEVEAVGVDVVQILGVDVQAFLLLVGSHRALAHLTLYVGEQLGGNLFLDDNLKEPAARRASDDELVEAPYTRVAEGDAYAGATNECSEAPRKESRPLSLIKTSNARWPSSTCYVVCVMVGGYAIPISLALGTLRKIDGKAVSSTRQRLDGCDHERRTVILPCAIAVSL